MGMSASQARLLMITARIHDLEYKAQNIQNEKIMLATQSDRISKEFLEALDKYNLSIAGGTGENPHVVQGNYNNIAGPNAIDTGEKYLFIDSKTEYIIVPDNVAQAYLEYDGSNSKEFAEKIGGNEKELEYYSNLFEQIKTAGGCISIETYNGPDGDAANDQEVLQDLLKSGKIFMKYYEYGNPEVNATSPAVSPSVGERRASDQDKAELAKAQAIYEDKLRKINNKDKHLDIDLSKIETERSALTTEYDSVKKIINDNIERTFKIFS